MPKVCGCCGARGRSAPDAAASNARALPALTRAFLFSCRLNYALVTTAWVSMWLMWAIIYMAQMKPLIKPERE